MQTTTTTTVSTKQAYGTQGGVYLASRVQG
jgi:hypothetical protein